MIKLYLNSRHITSEYVAFLRTNSKVKDLVYNESSDNQYSFGSYRIPNNSICLDDVHGLVIALKNIGTGIKVFELESNKFNVVSSDELIYLSNTEATKRLNFQRKQYVKQLKELQQVILLLEAANNLK